MPPVPTAPPGGCALWGFPGETTFTNAGVDDPGAATFLGTVGPDGKVTSSNTSWTLMQPMTCVTKAEVIVIHVKDNSGVTSQCHYDSEFF